jgi:hypothetical protein
LGKQAEFNLDFFLGKKFEQTGGGDSPFPQDIEKYPVFFYDFINAVPPAGPAFY